MSAIAYVGVAGENEGLNTCTACGGHGSTDEHGYSYCCAEPTVPRDLSAPDDTRNVPWTHWRRS